MGIEKAAEWAAKYFLNPEVLCQSRPVGAYVHVGYEAHPEDTGSSGYRAGATSSFRQQQYYLALLSTTGETLAEVALPFFEKEFVAQRTREVAAELYALAVGAQFRKCLPDAVPDTDLPTSTSEKYLVEGKNWGGREADFSYEAYLVEGPQGRCCEVRFTFSGGDTFVRRLSPDNFRQNTKKPECLTACWRGSKLTLVMSKEKAEGLFNDMDWEWPAAW